MAQLLAARGWAPPDPFAIYLCENLPADCFVVAATSIYGCPFEALVVAPNGIHVLYPKESRGTDFPEAKSPWTITMDGGDAVRRPNRSLEVQRCHRALTSFLNDEFLGLRPAIHHSMVPTRPEEMPSAPDDAWPPLSTVALVGETIVLPQPSTPPLDEPIRHELAMALRDRQLTASQRAAEPFIFRTGNRTAWTFREAAQHMDQFPADGIYHLRNGTLVHWLWQQGATHLADLAEEAMRQITGDEQAMLETFLIETGVVARPKASVRPSRLDLGSIVSGNTASASVRVRQERSRGYLFGSLRPSVPWLSVAPDRFAGMPLDAVITVQTATLPIRTVSYETTVDLISSASDIPLSISIQFRIVGMPSRLTLYALRPLALMGISALLGLGLGWLFTKTPIPIHVDGRAVWAVAVGWMAVGAVQGWRQPPAWSMKVMLQRWTLRLMIWMVGLSAVAAGSVWGGQRLMSWFGVGAPPISGISAGLAGAIIAIVPAAFWQRLAPSLSVEQTPESRRSQRLHFVIVTAILLLALILAAGSRNRDVRGAADRVAASTGQWLDELTGRLNHWTDDVILRYYDRRAPSRSE